MNKKELIASVARAASLPESDAKAAVEALFEGISKSLVAGETVRVVGFGTFSVAERAASVGRNPRTGVRIAIPASKLPRFRADKALKAAIGNDGRGGSGNDDGYGGTRLNDNGHSGTRGADD